MKLYKCPYCDYTNKSKIAINIHVYSTSDSIHGEHNKAPPDYNYNMIIELTDTNEPKVINPFTPYIKHDKEKLSKPFKCKFCNNTIVPDDSPVQFCKCGAYYTLRQDFVCSWKFGGWLTNKQTDTQVKRTSKPHWRR